MPTAPEPRPLVAAAMIVRDEAHNLPALFASAAELVDAWGVVDTGSTDDTRAVAEGLGATVIQDAWDDDFARSRNVSLEAAGRLGAAWLLVLDGDDRVVDGPRLRSFLESGSAAKADALLLRVDSPLVDGGVETFEQPRLFRTAAGVRYRHPAHAVPVLDGLRVATAPRSIRHLGYADGHGAVANAERTLRILRALPPDDPHRLYHELRAHAALGAWAQVAPRAEALLRACPPLPADVRTLWARALSAEGRVHEATRVLADGLVDHPHAPDLFHQLLQVAAVGYLGAARRAARTGPRGHLSTTLHRVEPVARGLVAAGLMRPELLPALGLAPSIQPPSSPGEELARRSHPVPDIDPKEYPCPRSS